ncbi:FecR family protein [Sediminitomix flava]|uniref:FecR family protein n=1 Tax=Sediminitomix flava TaxID=379075 RepID=A0A315ZZE8_SEDFL|nr:FecR family protein [Sediminitomix flava]PWJ42737.1 FecR family protein [Sediminitomix flava]
MNIDWQLIAKYIGNEVSTEERTLVEAKARENDSFAELLKDTQDIWNRSENLGKKGFIETDAAAHHLLMIELQDKINEWESEEAVLASYLENGFTDEKVINSFSDKDLLDESAFIWEKSKDIAGKNDLEINFQDVFNSLNQKISDQENKIETKQVDFTPKKKVTESVWKVQNIAAAVTLLIASLGILFVLNSSSQLEVVALNQTQKVDLPDGTEVWLQKGASLKYPESFGNTREVDLEGNAFFEVAKNASKPFIIHTGETYTKVLGTSFLLENTNNETSINVFSGKVQFGNENNQIFLIKSEAAAVKDGHISKTKFEVQNRVNFIQDALVFKNTPLSKASHILNTAFQAEIVLDQKISNKNISGDFSGKSLNEIVKIIEEIYGTTSEVKKDGSIYMK